MFVAKREIQGTDSSWVFELAERLKRWKLFEDAQRRHILADSHDTSIRAKGHAHVREWIRETSRNATYVAQN